jgi:predicted transcriptional regulator
MRAIREIMEPNVFWLPDDMPLKRAAQALAERQISGAPACTADGKIVGMLSKTDLTDYYGGVNELRLVRDVMTPEVFAVHPDDPIDRAIQLMAFEGVHRVLVLENDALAGILTSMDVLRDLAGFPPRARGWVRTGPGASDQR